MLSFIQFCQFGRKYYNIQCLIFVLSLKVIVVCVCYKYVLFLGWGLTHEPVYLGFIIAFAWILVFLFISGLGLHFKK